MQLQWLNGKGWRVAAPLPFEYGTVPMGFVSDGVTLKLPVLRWLVNPQGPALRAAVIHDYMYVNALENKRIADDYFYINLINDGVPRWKAKLMHTAVYYFGRGAY